jgi:hypothetical protein
MFTPSFVSIYILPNKILIVQFDSKKKKTKKITYIDLPEGIIQGNRVHDKAVLAKILKNSWDKLHLSEKSLGIILPEFSTFTKLITIPKLPFSELDEAVRWQAKEFSPSSLKNTVMDWMIVGKNDSDYEILVVAMDKDILMNYVDAAQLAGLFPLAVTIPSVCLTALVDSKDKEGSLIVYKNANETIVIISAGEKIFGTSVVKDFESKPLITIIQKMIFHYKQVDIKNIYVGGSGIDQAFLTDLKRIINKEAKGLTLKIKGASEKDIQEYLIPIGMQSKELEGPTDPFSLNLLPFASVEKYKKAKLKLQIWGLTLTITLFVWVSLLVTLGAYLFMVQQISEYKSASTLSQDVVSQRGSVTSDVKFVNDMTQKILKIKTITVPPQKVLNIINESKSPGLIVSDYKLDLEVGFIELSGTASTRADLLSLKTKLETNPDVGSIIIPISSFESEINQEFKLTFNYLPISSNIPKKK